MAGHAEIIALMSEIDEAPRGRLSISRHVVAARCRIYTQRKPHRIIYRRLICNTDSIRKLKPRISNVRRSRRAIDETNHSHRFL